MYHIKNIVNIIPQSEIDLIKHYRNNVKQPEQTLNFKHNLTCHLRQTHGHIHKILSHKNIFN